MFEALRKVSAGGNAEDLTAALRQALLEFGSETPDNRAMAAQLKVGPSRDANESAFGPQLDDLEIPLADFA